MDYYISDEKLKLREFGRNVQMMVNIAKETEDEDERNALANAIVRIMANINPSVKENPEYRQHLWDSLYHLADYDIDLQAPYPMPEPEVVLARPEKRMDYYKGSTRYKQYGRNVELLVTEAIKMEDLEERRELVEVVANYMKLQIKGGEKDAITETTVFSHLREISKGKLQYKSGDIQFYRAPVPPPAPNYTTKTKSSNKKRKPKRK